MYPQLVYRDVVVGAVYICPPGGMIFACVGHERTSDLAGTIHWLVLDEGAMGFSPGDIHKVDYCHLDSGSWTRIA